MGRESLYYWFRQRVSWHDPMVFDIPSKLIHWRLNLVRTLGAYVPWLRRDDGSDEGAMPERWWTCSPLF